MAPFFVAHPVLLDGSIGFAIVFVVDVVTGYALSDRLLAALRR